MLIASLRPVRKITDRAHRAATFLVLNVLRSERRNIPFGKAKVNQEHCFVLLALAHADVLGLDVPVDK